MQKCTNRFFSMGVKIKRVFYLVFCVLLIAGLSSCEEVTSFIQSEKIVAVEYDSANEIACEEYVSEEYTKVTYNSASDVVLAVENMKAECGILDEFELNSFVRAGRNIKQTERCEYSIDYCAYFDLENDSLQKSFNSAIKKLNDNGVIENIKQAYLNGEEYSRSKINNENGTLTMLCDPYFDNRVYTDDNGEIVGLDVDIAYEICNYLGYELEIATADFDELFVKLEEGEGDFIVSACEDVAERCEYYLLSDIYFTLEFYLIERK